MPTDWTEPSTRPANISIMEERFGSRTQDLTLPVSGNLGTRAFNLVRYHWVMTWTFIVLSNEIMISW